jgi:ribonuclease Z
MNALQNDSVRPTLDPMRPLFHPTLVNGRSGDPALYIETQFANRAVLFDIGDIAALPPRKILRIGHVFVSHAHIDHFFGFDRLLRLLVGREKEVALYGPAGFIDHVHHRLQAYWWNLSDSYASDLVFAATEIVSPVHSRRTRFRLKNAFAPEPGDDGAIESGVICSEPAFRVSTAMLEHHRAPCLGFAIQEVTHVNVWKSRLTELGLPVGSWLRDLKDAVAAGRPGDHVLRVPACRGGAAREIPLSALRDLLTVTPGQKVAYVTDIADTAANRAAAVGLVRNADLLFIESPFAAADAALAAGRSHLTTAAAGAIAREAGVRRVEPFHFSPRYAGQEVRMLDEVNAAFDGRNA